MFLYLHLRIYNGAYIIASPFKYFSFISFRPNGVFMKKKMKLAIVGIAAFLIVLGVFLYIILTTPPAFFDDAQYFSASPYFVREYLKANPGYKPTASLDISNIRLEKVSLSKTGFSKNELIVNVPTLLRISNSSDKIRNIVVTSPSLDGTPQRVSQFVIGQGKDAVLNLIIAPYLEEIITRGKAKIEKTAKGYLIFEISCVLNCDPENNYIRVYLAQP